MSQPQLVKKIDTPRPAASPKPTLLEQVTISEVQRLFEHLKHSVSLWNCD